MLQDILGTIRVRAWRFHLSTPGVLATVPMLRGVWGAALHDLDRACYAAHFDGAGGVARYLLRPAAAGVEPAPAVEFLRFGSPDPYTDALVWAAWEEAEARGLGPNRIPFRIDRIHPLAWDGTALGPARDQPGFLLDALPWPSGDPSVPCRLDVPAPLRLLRDGRLIQSPTPADLTLAALRRLHALAGPVADPLWADRRIWLDAAREVPSLPWQGRRLDLVRYSGSQRREVELHGVCGHLDFPSGPGPLAPLLNAARWLHLGKGTVMGLGQIEVQRLSRFGDGTPLRRSNEPHSTHPSSGPSPPVDDPG